MPKAWNATLRIHTRSRLSIPGPQFAKLDIGPTLAKTQIVSHSRVMLTLSTIKTSREFCMRWFGLLREGTFFLGGGRAGEFWYFFSQKSVGPPLRFN